MHSQARPPPTLLPHTLPSTSLKTINYSDWLTPFHYNGPFDRLRFCSRGSHKMAHPTTSARNMLASLPPELRLNIYSKCLENAELELRLMKTGRTGVSIQPRLGAKDKIGALFPLNLHSIDKDIRDEFMHELANLACPLVAKVKVDLCHEEQLAAIDNSTTIPGEHLLLSSPWSETITALDLSHLDSTTRIFALTQLVPVLPNLHSIYLTELLADGQGRRRVICPDQPWPTDIKETLAAEAKTDAINAIRLATLTYNEHCGAGRCASDVEWSVDTTAGWVTVLPRDFWIGAVAWPRSGSLATVRTVVRPGGVKVEVEVEYTETAKHGQEVLKRASGEDEEERRVELVF